MIHIILGKHIKSNVERILTLGNELNLDLLLIEHFEWDNSTVQLLSKQTNCGDLSNLDDFWQHLVLNTCSANYPLYPLDLPFGHSLCEDINKIRSKIKKTEDDYFQYGLKMRERQNYIVNQFSYYLEQAKQSLGLGRLNNIGIFYGLVHTRLRHMFSKDEFQTSTHFLDEPYFNTKEVAQIRRGIYFNKG